MSFHLSNFSPGLLRRQYSQSVEIPLHYNKRTSLPLHINDPPPTPLLLSIPPPYLLPYHKTRHGKRLQFQYAIYPPKLERFEEIFERVSKRAQGSVERNSSER